MPFCCLVDAGGRQTRRELSEHWQASMERLRVEVEAARDTALQTQAADYQEHCKRTLTEHGRSLKRVVCVQMGA